MQTNRLNFQTIEINGEVVFREISIANNPDLTQGSLREIVDAFQGRLINRAQVALFIHASEADYYNEVCNIILGFPRLKNCILRIGADAVWLPTRVYFKDDPRFN